MNIRIPQSLEEDIRFCSEEFKISFPQIGAKALRSFYTSDLLKCEIKTEKTPLSKEGYNFGDRPFCYTTEEFRDIIVWYVNEAMENHNKHYTPLQLDECNFETDEQQLLIRMAEDRIREKIKNLLIPFEGELGYEKMTNYKEVGRFINELSSI